MHLSLFSDYSLRILMFAALKDGVFRVDEVTDAYGISRHHAAKVIHHLGKLGYLETRRGRGGGIQLARQPAEIQVGKLVRATEGAPAIVECFNPATNTCRISPVCRLKGVLADAMSAFYESLDRFTLADLVTGLPRNPMRRILLEASA